MIWVYNIIRNSGEEISSLYISEVLGNQLRDIMTIPSDENLNTTKHYNLSNVYFPDEQIKDNTTWHIDIDTLQKFDCTFEEFIEICPEYFI